MPSRLVAIVAPALIFVAAVAGYLYLSYHPVHAGAPVATASAAPPGTKPASLAELKTETPKPAADIAFSDASGARHTLSSYRGHYVLLNLWATWCAPCVKELPELAKLQSAVVPAKLSVVTVNVGHSTPAETGAFLKAHQAAALPVFVDSDTAFIRAFGAFGLPLSILIDPKGREIARAVGPAEWDKPQSVAWFKALGSQTASR